MKATKLIMTVLFISSAQFISAQHLGENKEIKEAINNYLEGQRTDNPELIKKVFHKDANLKFISVRDSTYNVITLEKYLTFFSNKKKRVFKDKIFYIDGTGTAANVKLLIKYEDYQYTHYFNMLKTNEGWKIVNKITCQENF